MAAVPPLQSPRTISQRELRNNSAQIMRALEAGDSFVLTNNGREIARVVPIDQPAYRPAVPHNPDRRAVDITSTRISGTLQEILDDLRADRV